MDPVASCLARAADAGLVPRGERVLLAVSGGPDSMALLCGCTESAKEFGWTLGVAHVHHGVRGRDADRDLAFVKDHARRLGLPFFFRRRDAAMRARSARLSPEAAARSVRYEALAEMAREFGARRIAVAHQKDDVAESCLLAIGRRGGIASLAGPREARADGVVRPLLGVARSEILDFLRVRGIGYRRDATNGDLRLARNRARRRLETPSGRSESAALVALASSCEAQRVPLERVLEDGIHSRLHRGTDATLADARWLAEAPADVARWALSRAGEPYARPSKPPLTGRERESLLDRLRSGLDFRFEAGRRIRYERRGSLLTVRPAPARVDSGDGGA